MVGFCKYVKGFFQASVHRCVMKEKLLLGQSRKSVARKKFNHYIALINI